MALPAHARRQWTSRLLLDDEVAAPDPPDHGGGPQGTRDHSRLHCTGCNHGRDAKRSGHLWIFHSHVLCYRLCSGRNHPVLLQLLLNRIKTQPTYFSDKNRIIT